MVSFYEVTSCFQPTNTEFGRGTVHKFEFIVGGRFPISLIWI